jgi:hypothetical protein
MSAWDELREAWRWNTPIWRMTTAARWLFLGLLVGFLAFMVGLAVVLA